MTVKEFLPKLPLVARMAIGKRFANRYKCIFKNKPSQVKEDEFMVCDYTHDFLLSCNKVINRYSKKYPDADVDFLPRRKRTRIKING